MKNLIIIHLESLSNQFLYDAPKEVFPNLNRILKNSLFFQNYYSTATSTIMTVGDLMYGDLYQLEKSRNLEDVCKQKTIDSAFEQLEQEGYHTAAYVYPCFSKCNKMDRINLKKIFGRDTHYEEFVKRDDFQEKIANTIKMEEPFAIYVYDYTSLLASPFRTENVEHNFLETVEESYRQIDQTVGFIFETLQSEKRMNDTAVILFGDHGDDLYSHGYTHGFTHAIEPYASVTRTPLAIYFDGIRPAKTANLVNTLDIRKMVMSLLKEQHAEDSIRLMKRKYAFSRNLFWNQKSNILNKAYSITDGKYMLMVSKEGLELYLCRYESFGVINLLNFFEIDGAKIRLKKEMQYMTGIHVEYMLKRQENSILHEFITLKAGLIRNLEKLESNTGLSLNFRPWFRRIRQDEHIQKELNAEVMQGRQECKKTSSARRIKAWITRFVS